MKSKSVVYESRYFTTNRSIGSSDEHKEEIKKWRHPKKKIVHKKDCAPHVTWVHPADVAWGVPIAHPDTSLCDDSGG